MELVKGSKDYLRGEIVIENTAHFNSWKLCKQNACMLHGSHLQLLFYCAYAHGERMEQTQRRL